MTSCLLMPTCGAAKPTPSLECMVAVMSRTSPRVVPLTMSSLLHGRDANRSAGLPIRKMLNAAVDVAGAVAAAPLKMEPISDDISRGCYDRRSKLFF